MDHDRLQLRMAALAAAAQIAAGDCQPMQVKVQQVAHATEQFYQLLTAEGPPVRLVLRTGMVYEIRNSRRVFDGWPIRKGTAMQLKDTQQVDLTVEAVDARGFDVADTITWQAGQRRAYLMWTRLVRPDGVSIALASPAADFSGQAGVGGQVNSHFFSRFGSSILLSILGGAGGLVTGGASTVIVGGAGSSAASVAAQHDGARGPTIKVRQGEPIRVFTARDLIFSDEGANG